MESDSFNSDDNPFDGIDESELVRLEIRSTQAQVSSLKHASDDVDTTTTKRQKIAGPEPHESKHLALANKLLDKWFGFKSFRHQQASAIERILKGKNALVVFPTGAGKSLCYQIPAIAFPEMDATEGTREPGMSGVTIVVSPLLALMKDQVDALRLRGIPADCIDSTKSWDELQVIHSDLRKGQLRLVYCAPERLNNEGFVESIKSVPGGIRLLAVDEAHCISEWGHSFRPDYLKIARFVEEIKAERVICLTATATPVVADDICKAFEIDKSCVFKTSPYRPNLHLTAKTFGSDDQARFEYLFGWLRKHHGSTLVYVTLQQQAETHAEVLRAQGFKAVAFHAGMKTADKKKIQEDFMSNKADIVCATIAFGMGIDKADIRNIVHWDIPSSLEEYSQQIGRAGRDGQPSECLICLAPNSIWIRELFARGDLPSYESLDLLLQDIFSRGENLTVDDVIKVGHYSQSGNFDIRMSPLAVIYATLELHFGLIRAITPEYTKYQFEPKGSYWSTSKSDPSPEAKAILKHAPKRAKWCHIDVTAAAKAEGLKRIDLVSKLNRWNDSGHLVLQAGGMEHRYRILQPLPQTAKERKLIVDKVYAALASREQDALERGQQVMDLLTGKKCFAAALASHFGMNLPEGRTACGHCTVCTDGKAPDPPNVTVYPTTAGTIQPVLKAIKARDDPRFLARVAFGIKSPRVTKMKLDRDPVFRSLNQHAFEDLLREFSKACGKKYANIEKGK